MMEVYNKKVNHVILQRLMPVDEVAALFIIDSR